MQLSLAEKYRPHQIEDFALNPQTLQFVEDLLEHGITQNLLFHGPAGTGKSSLAFFLRDHFKVGQSTLTVNASEETGIDIIRDKVKRFVSTSALGCDFKLCILSEVDGLSRQAQQALKDILEESARTGTYFILTTNRPEKLIEEIISRCMTVKVEPDKDSFMGRLDHICFQEEMPLSKMPEVAQAFETKYYPDLRRAINWIESGFVGDQIEALTLATEILILLQTSRKIDDLFPIRKFWMEQVSSSSEYELISGELVNVILKSEIEPITKIKVVRSLNSTLNHYATRQDKELNFYCSIADIWGLIHEH